MPRIAICIPSYRRADKVRTLGVCPFATVYVDEHDADAYRERNDAEIFVMPDGIQGNIARVRNWILEHEFANGADAVCMMDDDIRGFGEFRGRPDYYGYIRDWFGPDQMAAFIERNTELCSDLGLTMWGVNTIYSNRQYHQSEPFSLTKVILGPFSVHLSRRFRYDASIPLKEDYDMFLQHMERDRAVLRINSAFYDNGGSNLANGGCASQRSSKAEESQFDALQRKWGNGIIARDKSSKRKFDFNPIVHVPIQGV